MLNSDLRMFRIPLLTSPNYRIINKNINSLGSTITVMIPINEEEESNIDLIDTNTIKFNRGDRTFSVKMKDIYCYGSIDLHDEHTIDQINSFPFLSNLGSVGVHMVANYDYETHSCLSPERYYLNTETWTPIDLIKYAHAYLGKPQRVLLFKQNIK